MINYSLKDFQNLSKKFQNAIPFDHIVLDNFLNEKIAKEIANEFPKIDDPIWYSYNNAIEKKRTMNFWDKFQPNTYKIFTELFNPSFVECMKSLSGVEDLYGDYGLSGGGLHLHENGQKLNIHLDYSIHPKLKMERILNIILYITPEWDSLCWNGGLELWSHDSEKFQPKNCMLKINNLFNRAVIFRTNKFSWHGLPNPITCPEGIYRRSLAAYYLTTAREGVSEREKALFAPMPEQKDDKDVLDLIKKRSQTNSASSVYRDGK